MGTHPLDIPTTPEGTWDQIYLPPRRRDWHMWKHYLPPGPTSLAGGITTIFVNLQDKWLMYTNILNRFLTLKFNIIVYAMHVKAWQQLLIPIEFCKQFITFSWLMSSFQITVHLLVINHNYKWPSIGNYLLTTLFKCSIYLRMIVAIFSSELRMSNIYDNTNLFNNKSVFQ